MALKDTMLSATQGFVHPRVRTNLQQGRK